MKRPFANFFVRPNCRDVSEESGRAFSLFLGERKRRRTRVVRETPLKT